MAFSVTLAGKTFTEVSFEGNAYADETDGFPAALQKVVEHVAGFGISTSTTSLAIGTGSKSLTVSADTPFAVGMYVLIAETAAPSTNWMYGQITAWNGTTGAMTVDVDVVGGSGTIAAWTVSVSGARGTTGAAGADGADGEVQNSDFQDGTPIYATGAGTANAQTLTLAPAITAYTAGQGFRFKAGATNTGAATLNVNGLGAKSIKKCDGTIALVAGDITTGQIIHVVYDGTNFQMIADRKLPAPVASKYGAIPVQNDADDGYDLLTSQGTAGQALMSNGPDALPSFQDVIAATWADYDGTADGAYDLLAAAKVTTSYGYRAARLSDTKAVLLYLDTTNEFIYGHIMTYDPVAKDLTFGAKQTVVTGGTSAFNNNSSFISDTIEVIDATNFVFGYREFDGVSKNEAKTALCSISGDTITVDATATYNTVSTDRISVSLIDSTKVFVGIVGNNTVKGNVASITVGTSIAYNTWTDVEPSILNGSSGSFSCKADSNGACALIVCNDTSTANNTKTVGVGISGTTVSAGTPQHIEVDGGASLLYGQVKIRNIAERQFGFLTNSMLNTTGNIYRDYFVTQCMTTSGGTNANSVVGSFIQSSNSTMTPVQVLEMADHDLIFHYTNVAGIQMSVVSKGYSPVVQHSAQVMDMADVTGTKNLDFNTNSSCVFVEFDDDAVAMIFGDSTTQIGYKIIRKK